MVEYVSELDYIFYALADPTRRDIITRVARSELSVGELAIEYDMSLAAVSKHLKILQETSLIIKRREGKKQMISLNPSMLDSAREYLEQFTPTALL